MKKINVLEMIDKPFLGGGQINILSLARFLNKDRFNISVCSKDDGALVDELKTSKIRHFPVSFSKRIKIKTLTQIENIMRNHQFDILHTHSITKLGPYLLGPSHI